MRMPGRPNRSGPPTHRTRVLLRRGTGDVGDRDSSSFARDGGFFNVTRAREPALYALAHLLRTPVLDRDREAGEVRRERAAGKDVPVVLAGVAVNGEAPHRGVSGVLECAETEVVEELLASIAATRRGTALGTGLEVDRRF